MSVNNYYKDIEKELFSRKNALRAEQSARYFKTGKGEYAEGDAFLGLTVPETRAIVKRYRDKLRLQDIE